MAKMRPELTFKQGTVLVDYIRIDQWVPDQVLILEIQTRQKYVGGMVSVGNNGTLTAHLMMDDASLDIPEQDNSLGMTEVSFKAPPGDWQVYFCGGRYSCRAIFYNRLAKSRVIGINQDGSLNWG